MIVFETGNKNLATLEEKKSEKRSRILNASLRLFVENGFHATPISLIADTACLGTGTIYRYFQSKDELINELYRNLKSRLTEAIFSDFSARLTVRENFFRLWESLTVFFMNNEPEALFLDLCSNNPVISEETMIETDRLFMPLRSFVADAMKNGEIEEVQPEIIWAFISGPIQTIIKMNRKGRIKLDPSIIRNSFEFFWKSLEKQ